MEQKHRFNIRDYVIEITNSDFSDIIQQYMVYHRENPKVKDKHRRNYLESLVEQYKVS